MIKISIIVPVYNSETTLERCVVSLQHQTYTDIQIILVNDGSTDKSKAICDSFAQTDSRIYVIHQKNAGVSAARNAGLAHAAGEYIMFCDSDDWVEPDWCEKMLTVAEHSSTCLPVSNYWHEKDGVSSINYADRCAELKHMLCSSDMFALYKMDLLGIPWNKIYHRKAIEDNNLRFDESISLGEDLIFVIDYIKYISDGFIFISEPLYHYALGNMSSLTMRYNPDLRQTYQVIFNKLKEHLVSIPTAWERYEKDYWHSYFWAMEKVMYNSFSDENNVSILDKISYNSAVYRSKEFAIAKSCIDIKEVNIMQYCALRFGSFSLYWLCKILSEHISGIIHGR